MLRPIYLVDTFTHARGGGSSVAVALLEFYPRAPVLQAIAARNRFGVTAFPILRGDGCWELCCFTASAELRMSGRAALAAASVLFAELLPMSEWITFILPGTVQVAARRSGTQLALDLPVIAADRVDSPDFAIPGSSEVWETQDYTLVVLSDADAVCRFRTVEGWPMAPDRRLVLTAPGDGPHDFVSRCFDPGDDLTESDASGTAHALLIPYWAKRLGKTELRGWQASVRGAEFWGKLNGSRVEVRGTCDRYLAGLIDARVGDVRPPEPAPEPRLKAILFGKWREQA